MKKIICLFVLLLNFSANAALINDQHNILASGEGSVGYTAFEVTVSGLFDVYTMGPTIDPQLYLFSDDGLLDTTDFITSNDDSCPTALCGPAGAFSNSLINNIFLDVGFYIAAISDFSFSLDEAISGLNINNRTGLASIVIDTADDSSFATQNTPNSVAAVNAPASIALLFASFGLLLFRRK